MTRSAIAGSSPTATTQWPTLGRTGRAAITDDPRAEWLEQLLACSGGRAVVELGAATAPWKRAARAAPSADRRRSLGGTAAQSARARARRDLRRSGDLTTIEFDPGSLDAVAPSTSSTTCHASYSQRSSRASTAGCGRAACCWRRSARGSESWEGEWLGVQMFFSSFLRRREQQLAPRAGFELCATRSSRSPSPTATWRSSGCSRADELHLRARALSRAPAGGARRAATAGPASTAAAGRRPDPAARRRPVAGGGARGRRGGGGGGRLVDVVPDDALGLLQPRVGGGRAARSCACASSAIASPTTRCTRTSISTSVSIPSSPGTTPIPSTCANRSPAQ